MALYHFVVLICAKCLSHIPSYILNNLQWLTILLSLYGLPFGCLFICAKCKLSMFHLILNNLQWLTISLSLYVPSANFPSHSRRLILRFRTLLLYQSVSEYGVFSLLFSLSLTKNPPSW